jgi:hypothetical protein
VIGRPVLGYYSVVSISPGDVAVREAILLVARHVAALGRLATIDDAIDDAYIDPDYADHDALCAERDRLRALVSGQEPSEEGGNA